MIQSTTDYDKFTKLPQNRLEGISEQHVRLLVESIKKNNLLHLNHIIVNDKFEVIGGQHRLEAARRLGVPIYYVVDSNSTPNDMLLMGFSKRWNYPDVLNFYVQAGHPEYIKFRDFLKHNGLETGIGITIMLGQKKTACNIFKLGEYKHKEEYEQKYFDYIKDIIEAIRNFTVGYQPYTCTAKLYIALLKLVMHPDYKHERMLIHVKKYTHRIGPKNQIKEYIRMFYDVYNFKSVQRIQPLEAGFDISEDNL